MSISSEMLGECDVSCKHGGVCRLDVGHKGKHNSDYCTWDNKESISKEDANRILAEKMKKQGHNAEIINLVTAYT